MIEDLAEATGRGDLRVYLEYSPTEEGMRQQMAEKAAATESQASSRDTAPEVAEQPRPRKSVERPPQDSDKSSAAGAIPRAPTAEADPIQESRELP
ncbi:hypothetical protein [Salicola sp. Rm-C-2C1-2]|uniref:hypothetical protein n=1 Tax=Salicola sp. Rm-C-2C1-2 TaxID=3141321 RepID=UPI0032E4E531